MRNLIFFSDSPFDLYLPEGESLDNPETVRELMAVFRGKEPQIGNPPNERLITGPLHLDLDSRIGFHVQLRDATIIQSYIGNGWGVWKGKIHNSILIDHVIRDAHGNPVLPSFADATTMTNTLTSIHEAVIRDSVLFPGSGISMRIEGGRTGIAHNLSDTIVPEGRLIEKPQTGLMRQEVEFVESLQQGTENDVRSLVEELVSQREDKGRFTTLAVSLCICPHLDTLIFRSLSDVDARKVRNRLPMVQSSPIIKGDA